MCTLTRRGCLEKKLCVCVCARTCLYSCSSYLFCVRQYQHIFEICKHFLAKNYSVLTTLQGVKTISFVKGFAAAQKHNLFYYLTSRSDICLCPIQINSQRQSHHTCMQGSNKMEVMFNINGGTSFLQYLLLKLH